MLIIVFFLDTVTITIIINTTIVLIINAFGFDLVEYSCYLTPLNFFF